MKIIENIIKTVFDHYKTKQFRRHMAIAFIVGFLAIFVLPTHAQDSTSDQIFVTISGKVTDPNSEPISGVTVKIKSTSQGTFTNGNGNFSIRMKRSQLPKKAKVIFSSLGMKKKTVLWSGKPIKVKMEEAIHTLDNVVVTTGYQKIPRNYLTSSVSTVKADKILTPGMSTIDMALEGRIPDLVSMVNSGAVGATSRIRIRGTSTILGNREPLWVVDGFIVTDPVNINPEQLNDPDFVNIVGNAVAGVNPQDIDQIDVLKDASATALYGTRAANGVIVITTKRGKEGPIRINYDHTSKFQIRPSYTDNNTNLMTSYERVQFGKSLTDQHYVFPYDAAMVGYEGAYLRYQNKQTTYSEFLSEIRKAEATNTDWLQLLTRNSYSPVHNLQISGGTQHLRYYASIGYNKDEGVAIGEFSKRYSLRANLNARLTKKIRLNIGMNGNVQKKNHSANEINIVDFAFNTSRAIPQFNTNNTPYFYDHRAYNVGSGTQKFAYNLFNELENSYNKYNGNRIGANANLRYAPINELEFSFSGSYANNNTNRERWWGEKSHYVSLLRNANYGEEPPIGDTGYSYLPYGGILYTTNTVNESFTGRVQTDYRQSFGENDEHFVNAMFGAEAFSNTYYTIQDESRGFYKDRGLQLVQDVDLDNYPLYKNWLNKSHRQISNGISNQLSYYMSSSYGYNNHFILNLNGRIDYSNKFGDRSMERFLPIWSVSGRWNLKRNVLSKVKIISDCNIRASYGKQGNMLDTESPNMIIRQGTIDPYYNENTSVIERFPNPNLKWEESHQINTAVEVGFFDNRLSVSAEYYYKLTENAFTNVSVLITNGTESYTMNGADVLNVGYNFQLNATPIRNSNFSWNIFSYISKNRNSVAGESLKKYSLGEYLNGTAIVNNTPVSTFYSYKYIGLNPTNGTPLFDDYQDKRHLLRNKSLDEVIQLVLENSGTREPIISGSISNSFRYKQFRLNIHTSYSIGSKMRLFPLFQTITGGVKAELNVRKEFLNRWIQSGDEKYTDIPTIMSPAHPDYKNYIAHYSGNNEEKVVKLAENVWSMYDQSNLRVVSGDYLRLSSVSFGYRFDSKMLKKLPFEELYVSVNGLNLWVLSSAELKGQDPMQAGFATPQMSLRPTFTLQFNIGL